MKYVLKYNEYFIGLLVFVIYQFTLAPTVLQIDSGELAAVQATFGIAHPSGYPLFTLLGYLFSLIPLPFSTIYSLNLLASIYVAASTVFLIKTFKLIALNVSIGKNSVTKKKKQKNVSISTFSLSENVAVLVSTLGGLIIAFSKTFWFQSTSVEVYSLHILLISAIIFSIIKILLKSENLILLKDWLILAFILALGFGNHLTTFLILPGLAYVFFNREKISFPSFKKIGLMLSVFFPVLVVLYSTLVLRASDNPAINWGNPINFENFWRHFSGSQYQVWMFSSIDAAKEQLGYFFSILPSEFGYISFVLGLFGLLVGIKVNKKVYIFSLISFIFTILYAINYDINDIDSYFLLAFISFGIFAFLGLIFIIYSIRSFNINPNFYYIALVFPTVQFILNFSAVNQSNNYIYEDYTNAVFNGVERNGIIISYQWDYFISQSYYYQQSENIRKDIKIIDKELLRRSWYYNHLKTNYPDIINQMDIEISEFLKALKPFENKGAFDPKKLEFFYQAIMRRLITDNIDKYPIYIGPEFVENEIQRKEFIMPEGIILIPDGLLFRAVKSQDYVISNYKLSKLRFPPLDDKYTANIKNMIYGMLSNRAIYELNYNQKEKADRLINKIKELFPEKGLHPNLLK